MDVRPQIEEKAYTPPVDELLNIASSKDFDPENIDSNKIDFILNSVFSNNRRDISLGRTRVLNRTEIFREDLVRPYVKLMMQSDALEEVALASRNYSPISTEPVSEYKNLFSQRTRQNLKNVEDIAFNELPQATKDLFRQRYNYHRILEYAGINFLSGNYGKVTKAEVLMLIQDEYLRMNGAELIDVAEGIKIKKLFGNFSGVDFSDSETFYTMTVGVQGLSNDPSVRGYGEVGVTYESLLRKDATEQDDGRFLVGLDKKIRAIHEIMPGVGLNTRIDVGFIGSYHQGYAAGNYDISGESLIRVANKRGVSAEFLLKEITEIMKQEIEDYRAKTDLTKK